MGNHLIFLILKRHREIVKENIRTIGRGKYAEKEVFRLAKQCFQNYSHKLLDYMAMHQLNSTNQGDWVEKEAGEENLRKALAAGKGVICVTPHLSHWELGGYVLASKGYPINILTLREESQYLSRYEERLRKKAGIKTITIDLKERPNFSILEIIKRLRKNEIVAMVADRIHDGEGIEVEFFGRPTLFPSGAAHLAFETGAAIVPVFVVLEKKMKYRGIIGEPIPLHQKAAKGESIKQCVQEVARRFEEIISQYPDQWFNFFPYWKENVDQRV
jgi:KDO2-lipid IV(A) lauroyltransferase